MNQMHKEIAKILKQHHLPLIRAYPEIIARDLADYFEKESNELINKFSQLDANCPSPFDRKQFLKDCGLEAI